MSDLALETSPVTTALLLAAGVGCRLQPLTRHVPKCLTNICGTPILERLVHCLSRNGFQRLVVVVGYFGDRIRKYLGSSRNGLKIDYVDNPKFQTTNNLYSLWLARQRIQEPFLLAESDLVFDASLLEEMLLPNTIAVSRMQSWMHGTSVSIDDFGMVKAFRLGCRSAAGGLTYKTVNLYSFSQASWLEVTDRLERFVSMGKVNEYYESVFAEMVVDESLAFRAVDFGAKRWYEIDTLDDLHEAELIFANKRISRASPV